MVSTQSPTVWFSGMGFALPGPDGICKKRKTFWDIIHSGECCLSPFASPDLPLKLAGQVRNWDAVTALGLPPKQAERYSRAALLTIQAAKQAIEDAGLDVEDLSNDRTVLAFASLQFTIQHLPRYYDAFAKDGWHRTFGVNFEGFVNASQTAITAWTNARHPGTILSVSSIGADEAVIVPNLESYCSSKAAMTQYTRCLAMTWARYGIRANCIQPGIVQTPMSEWVDEEFQGCWIAQMPLARLCAPEEIAKTIAFMVSPASSYITGEVLKADGRTCSAHSAGSNAPDPSLWL